MKRVFLAAALFTFLNSGNAQEFNLKISGGYSWPGFTNTNTIAGFQPLLSNSIADAQAVLDPANASIVNLANSTAYGPVNPITGQYMGDTAGSKSLIHGSYGQGWNFSAEASCRISHVFAIGLQVSYLFGSTMTAQQLYGNNFSQTLGLNTTVTTYTRAYGLSLLPNVTIYVGRKKWKVQPYVKAALNLPVAGNLLDDIYVNSPNALAGTTKLSSQLSTQTQSKFSLGYAGSLGVSYAPIPLINIWAELSGSSLNVAAQTTTLTKYTIDGTTTTGSTTHADRIAGTGALPSLLTVIGVTNTPLTEYSKVIEYVDNLNPGSNTTDYGNKRANTPSTSANSGKPGYVNEGAAHQEQRVFAPFSNVGISIGITICMSKKIFQDPLGKKAKEKAKNQAAPELK